LVETVFTVCQKYALYRRMAAKAVVAKKPCPNGRFFDNRYIATASRMVRISGQTFGQRQNGCTKANRHQLTDNLSK
jgi:hypothetical protein